MATNEIAKRYVDLCKAGKNEVCLDELYAKDAVSVEAVAPPGMERVVKGLEAIRAKSKNWRESNDVHSAEVMGPFPNDNRLAVRFTFDGRSVDGVVDTVLEPSFLGVRTDDALLRFVGGGGVIMTGHHLFSEIDQATAERAWTGWLEAAFA